MHKVKHHQRHENDNSILIEATDHPGDMGMNHVYRALTETPASPFKHLLGTFEFQIGDPFRRGINGLTDEALLAIVIDRMEHAQMSPANCSQYGSALRQLHLVLRMLQERRREIEMESDNAR